MRLPVIALIAVTASLAAAQTRPHNFHLIDVKWHVDLKTYEDSGKLIGDVVNTMKVLSSPSSVSFDCAKLNVEKVEVDGKAAKFDNDGKMLKVFLPAGTKAGETVKIHVFYSGHPEAGLYLVPAARAYPAHTNVIYTQGEMVDNRYWLPTWDYPDDKATSEGIVEVNKGETVVSNGQLLGVADKPDRQIWHWKMDHPHATYLISIVAGKYDKGEDMWGSMPVDYYAPEGLLDWGKAAFGGTDKIIDFYSKLTGFKYPYAKFAQSAVPDYMFGGMENITAVTQTIDALHPASVDEVDDSTGLVAHELAHQWFGDTVTCNGWSDAWLNEGFATFLPPFWDREKYGQDQYDLDRYGIFNGGLAAHQFETRPVVFKGYKDALDMFNNFIYPGGASRMFMLMDMVGQDKFWNAITSYLNERKYTSLDTPMFFASMSKALGMDLTPFMKQWFYTPAAPRLTVTETDGKLTVSQPQPYFDLNLDVWSLNGDAWVKNKLHLTGEKATLDLGDMANKPVLVDPRCFVMANIANNIHFSAEDLQRLAMDAPNAGEQQRILDTMTSDLKPGQWMELANSQKVRPKVLPSILGHLLAATGGEAYLIGLTSGSDRGLVNASVKTLGNGPKSDAVIACLTQIASNDPDDVIRINATRGLIKMTGDKALLDKAWNTDGFHDEYRNVVLEYLSEHDRDQCREKCLQMMAHPTAEPTRVEAIRLLGSLKDKQGSLAVYKALVAVLKESSFGARSAAINALGEYGNAAAIPLIRPYQTASLVFFRQDADRVIAELGGK